MEEYSNYRDYLKDFYEEQKKNRSYFSFRAFCQMTGIKSPSLYKEVMAGTRNLTARTLPAFIKGLRLKGKTADYFTALVNFNQSRTDVEKQAYLKKMRGLVHRVNRKTVLFEEYEYYSKWYISAIRELACTFDWGEDYGLLARTLRPAIKKSEAKTAVELLLNLGFIIRNKDGRYVQKDPAITTGSEVISSAVRSLNKELAGIGRDAIERFRPSERDIRSIIVGVSPDGFSRIKDVIRHCFDRIVDIADADEKSGQVYNINIQLFPLSGKVNNRGANK